MEKSRLDPEQHGQSAAHGEHEGEEDGAVLLCLALQRFLVGLVGRGGRLECRGGAWCDGGAAGTHVVQVPGELSLPGFLP